LRCFPPRTNPALCRPRARWDPRATDAVSVGRSVGWSVTSPLGGLVTFSPPRDLRGHRRDLLEDMRAFRPPYRDATGWMRKHLAHLPAHGPSTASEALLLASRPRAIPDSGPHFTHGCKPSHAQLAVSQEYDNGATWTDVGCIRTAVRTRRLWVTVRWAWRVAKWRQQWQELVPCSAPDTRRRRPITLEVP